MAEKQALVSKRGTIKASITRIEKFIDQVDENVTVNNLKSRLAHLEQLYEKYDEIQMNLEVFDESEFGNDREIVENRFLDMKSRLSDLIDAKGGSDMFVSSGRTRVSGVSIKGDDAGMPQIDLPHFNGNYNEWHNFKDLFTNLVHNSINISDVRKLYYLKSSLKGEALSVIEYLHPSEQNYQKAWQMLTKRYDNKAMLLKTHLSGIFDLPQVGRNNFGLRSFINKFRQHYNSLQSLGVPIEHWDIILCHMLSQKLDNNIVQSYESGRNKSEFPNLDKFLDWLEDRCSTFEITARNDGLVKRTSTNSSQVKVDKGLQEFKKCIVCGDAHPIKKCNEFGKLSVEQRRNLVREKRLCFRCLKSNHFSEKCLSKDTCRSCNRNHNSLLHVSQFEKPSTLSAAAPVDNETKDKASNENTRTDVCTSITNSNCLNNNDESKIVLWPLALVYVINSDGNRIKCRALLDSASEKNYITNELVNCLQVAKSGCNWQVNGVSGLATNVVNTVNLVVESRNSNFKLAAEFGVMSNITGTTPKCEFNLRNLKWPRQIMLADPSFNKVGKIDMLLGTEMFAKVLKKGKIDLGENLPVLQNTEFGWVVHGSMVLNNCSLVSQVNQTLLTSVDNLNSTMLKFWEIETIDKQIITDEERKCESKFVNSVSRDKTGRYWVDLPVIDNKLSLLGNSYDFAYRCLLALERRFANNPELYRNYRTFINEYICLGHAKVVDISLDDKIDNTFYMPHHAVFKESSSTTKLRVVFNASAPSASGVSLNDVLLVGPVVQLDLVTILLRFRSYKYAITSDVTKMYRQVMIHNKYQPLQRILWRDTPDGDIQCVQLTTVTYGTACASFLATRAVLQLVSDEGDTFPLASEALKNNAYVDDIITGADTIESGQQMQNELIELLSKGVSIT